jgi:TolB-like protein/Tfp pilus assembly protein PilF
MPSVLPGFEYDIFISYRQKDNKGDRWVSEFVNALKTELESTFKEEISVYFDINPHDGLLETHDVNASLKEKLKCLVFVPIISRTYCDPKSFAWEHEFCAFNKLAKEEPSGRDIKLNDGNVASRILPVKIHDLDAEDKALLENELGGALRAIEFIYKEPGVNRPLKPTDNKNDNQNKTDYRNQVNKIANAIKEILGGLKNPSSSIAIPTRKDSLNISKSKSETFDSIAVLPFANMSSDPEQEYFSDGISEEIINVLAQLPNLKVAGRTSSFTFKGKNEDLRIIGEKLGVKTVLEGSVRSSGNRIRITAQLIDVQNGFHLWSEKYDREMKNIFEIQDEISLAIVEELKIKLFEEERIQILKSKTQNLKAYNYYLKGRFYWNNNRKKEGIEKTIEYFTQAIESDPNYALAYTGLADAYAVLADWGYMQTKIAVPKIKEFQNKSHELDDTLAENHSSLFYSYALFEWNWQKAEMESRKAFELNPKSPVAHHFYALFQACLGNFRNAIEHNDRARELDPLSLIFNFACGLILYMSHQYDDAIKQFRKTLEIDNSFTPAYFWTSFCYLQKGLYSETIEEYQNLLLRDPSTEKYVPVIDEIFKKSGIEGFLHWLIDEGIKLDKGIYKRTYHLAVCYALFNNKEIAFKWLAEACEQHVSWIAWIKVDPGFDNLRDDPRFSVLLEKVGLK